MSIIIIFSTLLTACSSLSIQFPEKDYFNLQFEEINIDSMMQEEQEKYYRYKNGIKDIYYVLEMNSEDGIYTVSNKMDIDVYINKYRKLPNNFRPKDLVEPKVNHYSPEGDEKRLMRKKAANALEKIFDKAQEEGLPLTAVSGFRSYERQLFTKTKF